jgi:nucleotide-binding universal stress UspA family protein
MSATGFLLGMFLTWVAIGVVSAVVMGRRGYAPFSWLILGAVLGPLVVPLAFSRTRQARRLPPAGDAGTWRGPVDVIVGIDGSAESTAAAKVIGALFGDRIGRFALAIVVDYDAALAGETGPGHRRARLELDQAVETLADAVPQNLSALVLAGHPAEALIAHAVEGRFDVIAVGSRGQGASKVVMGSVATRLAQGAPVPVLVVGHPEG